MISCPSGCAAKSKFKVFGENVFHGKSSVCRAAVYVGELDDSKGGVAFIQIVPGKEKYPSNS
jgi:hypothetical protein